MRHLACCLLASGVLSAAALAAPPVPRAQEHAPGIVLSDGPVQLPPTPIQY